MPPTTRPGRPPIIDTLFFENQAEWRSWLADNYDRSKGEWILFYKKHAGRPTLVYHEALDEALCFGWIDTTVRAVDEDSYAQRWTPRQPRSSWSEVNKAKVARLTEAGLMAVPGLAAVEAARADGRWDKVINRNYDPELPLAWLGRLQAEPVAWKHYESLPPGVRRQHLRYVMEAKQEATRLRRFELLLKAMRLETRLKAIDAKGTV